MSMIRKQIYLDQRHDDLLKRLAKARQASEAEIIRQALDREALAGQWLGPNNPTAWRTLLDGFEARTALPPTAEPYSWRRADAYEEREVSA